MISGETLRLLRNIKGIKQETMAKSLGITQPAYCKLEHSQYINGEKLQKLLAILNYTEKEIEQLKKFLPPPKISKQFAVNN